MMLPKLNFGKDGYILAVSQCWQSGEVLITGVMNEEALQKTVETNKVHYFSRSRNKLWLKGETSGHFQLVKEIRYNCEENSVVCLVEQIGVACHTGNFSCYYRSVGGGACLPLASIGKTLNILYSRIAETPAEPVIAAKSQNKSETINETADLLYRLSVEMAHNNIEWSEIAEELERRYNGG
jgi:phosphoribosyl-ATP pyrophosphohydrolase/phosphoribosyl-AMP cyclohydrolase